MIIDSKYDNIFPYFLWGAWYPFIYWVLNATIVMFALPKAIKSRIKEDMLHGQVQTENSQNHLNQSFIIRSKRIWWRELVVGLFTLLVWLYCLTVIYFFIDAIFSLHHEYPLLFRIVLK